MHNKRSLKRSNSFRYKNIYLYALKILQTQLTVNKICMWTAAKNGKFLPRIIDSQSAINWFLITIDSYYNCNANLFIFLHNQQAATNISIVIQIGSKLLQQLIFLVSPFAPFFFSSFKEWILIFQLYYSCTFKSIVKIHYTENKLNQGERNSIECYF